LIFDLEDISESSGHAFERASFAPYCREIGKLEGKAAFEGFTMAIPAEGQVVFPLF